MMAYQQLGLIILEYASMNRVEATMSTRFALFVAGKRRLELFSLCSAVVLNVIMVVQLIRYFELQHIVGVLISIGEFITPSI